MLTRKELFTVKCDNCGLEASEPQDEGTADKIAIDNGWEYLIDGRYFCPDCCELLKRQEELIKAFDAIKNRCLARKSCSQCLFHIGTGTKGKYRCGVAARPKNWSRLKVKEIDND